jgi:thiamine pyrophosphate-dependent acetolactate synthase large subunit-like protein
VFRHADGEFHTAARYGLPIKLVINNNLLGMIMWEQMVLGYPEYGARAGGRCPTMRMRTAAAAWDYT